MLGVNLYSNPNPYAKDQMRTNLSPIQFQGTKTVQYTPISLDQTNSNNTQSSIEQGMAITFQSCYASFSLEELREIDYQIIKRRNYPQQFQSNNSQGYNAGINSSLSNHYANPLLSQCGNHVDMRMNYLAINPQSNSSIGGSGFNSNTDNRNQTMMNNGMSFQTFNTNANSGQTNVGMSNDNRSISFNNQQQQPNSLNNQNCFNQATPIQNEQKPPQLQSIPPQYQHQFAMTNQNQSNNNHFVNYNHNNTNQQQPSLFINTNQTPQFYNNSQQQLNNNQITSQQLYNQNNLVSYPSQDSNVNSQPIHDSQQEKQLMLLQPQSFPSDQPHSKSIPIPQTHQPLIQYPHQNQNKSPVFNRLQTNNPHLELQKGANPIIGNSTAQTAIPINKNQSLLSFEGIANQIAQASPLFSEAHCSSIIQDTTNYTYLNALQNKMNDILTAVDSQLKQNEQLLINSIDDKGFYNEANNYYVQYNIYYNQSLAYNNNNDKKATESSSSFMRLEPQNISQLQHKPQIIKGDKGSEIEAQSPNDFKSDSQYYKSNGYLKEIEELGNKACDKVLHPHTHNNTNTNNIKKNRSDYNSDFPMKDKENRSLNSNTPSTSDYSGRINMNLLKPQNKNAEEEKTTTPSVNQIFTLHLSFYLIQPHLRDLNKDNRIITALLNKPHTLTASNGLPIESVKQLLAQNLASELPFPIGASDMIMLVNGTRIKDDQCCLGSIKAKEHLQFSFADDTMKHLSSIEGCEYPKTAQFSLSPSIEEMKSLSRYHLSHLTGFSIYNEHGRITFPTKTNVLGIDVDSIVTIQPFIVTAYRTKSIPPIGTELNKEAIIEIIISPEEGEDPNLFIENLKEKVAQLKASYISYDSIKQLLLFSVDSFNRTYAQH